MDGEIGTPIAAQAAIFGWEPTNDWFYDPAQGGGVILDTMVHFADLVTWMFGPARTVYTAGGAYKLEGAKKFGSPDNATVTIRHESGVVVEHVRLVDSRARQLHPGCARATTAARGSTSSTPRR